MQKQSGGVNIRLSAKIAGIFFCCTLLIIGTIVLLSDMSLDYNTVISACQYGLLGAVTAGTFGYLIGRVLEKPRKRSRRK